MSFLVIKTNKMTNTIHTIKGTWTWNHKTLIVAAALLVAHIYPLMPWPHVQANTITYQKPAIVDTSIEHKLQERAKELYKENENMDMERYRLEAIQELNAELVKMINDSPYVDYKKMKTEYGY